MQLEHPHTPTKFHSYLFTDSSDERIHLCFNSGCFLNEGSQSEQSLFAYTRLKGNGNKIALSNSMKKREVGSGHMLEI